MSNENVEAILLDIEGTTTPVEFVYEVLFPFARDHLAEFLRQHYQTSEGRSVISMLQTERSSESGRKTPPPWDENSDASLLHSISQYVYWLMDQDRKSTALKTLQGQIWKDGYVSGQLRAQVYPDVPTAFIRWREQQKVIHIFSSGSVLAQKLLFAHTTDGDLTDYINNYFDTTTGAKTAPASYRSISETIGRFAPDVLFVSDVAAELDAAQESGMQTALCVRSERPEPKSSSHRIVHTFDKILPG